MAPGLRVAVLVTGAALVVGVACSSFSEDEGTPAADAGAEASEAAASEAGEPDGGADGSATRASRTFVVVGGYGALPSDKIFLGKIEPKGIAWSAGPPLPKARETACAFVSGDRVFVAGGAYNSELQSTLSHSLDALTGGWTSEANPTELRRSPGCAFGAGALFYTGGAGGGGVGESAQVSIATATNGGAIVWSGGAPMRSAVQAHVAAYARGDLYAIGGAPCRASIAAAATAAGVMSWVDAGALPQPRYYGAAATDDDRIFVVGGLEGPTCATASASVLVLTVGAGAVTKIAAERALPEPRVQHAAVVVGKRLFVIGGKLGGTASTPSRSVISAEMNGDGTLGPWEDETSMPEGVASFALAIR